MLLPPILRLYHSCSFCSSSSFVFALLCWFATFRLSEFQSGICPLGFVWGGRCGFGIVCQPSLPPFHCLRGSCCRDQRPLFARLGPIVYPQDLLLARGPLPFPRFPGCFDLALNCYLFLPYCFVPVYRLCMLTHCRRTCGYCGLGPFGFGGAFRGGFGRFGGIGGFGGLGLFGGGLGGAFPGLAGIG